MKTAKLFQHGGSQAVRLPKEFRFEGDEVAIEKRGSGVLLKPVPVPLFETLGDVARHLADKYPDAADFPVAKRPRAQQRRDLDW
ncbi:MAG TPA: AbrB/MazE/SpoVT family DNA-binding domain-containing protein [Vicinamibacterales bacterium]